MKSKQARYWYTYLQRLADSLDALNEADALEGMEADRMYKAVNEATVNEAIRMAAQTAMAYCEDVTSTDEMPVVDLGEAS
jgi:hypothetical protein